ncbi:MULTISPECIES: HNH endonuclease [Providencia]|uniref:HNH endonuclease n=1 Tax=Providencia TaxID=586 RepID=UPI000D70327D|nr:HNH endonuclease [Providencia rettgeri]ELR5220128.1 HNH endonuclease [Providencia rettgeri]ELU1437119.1 HNH endonuclease [Providencia rettgeri]EMA4644489.1 HNH endonuclease [Providencia rettgeri]EMB0751309.1 HNH endonuclease [Providencia rettgeri]MDX7322654.1 HNH endonuclease [Providencia rettgeri]
MSKKRIGLTKKIRFEVFKRDGFTCQYCGDSAPKVVLNVDHIIPVSAGGDNNMMNLITSCFDCNQGKRDRLISDDSLITKQLSQVKEVSDKREQLLMMLAWRDELIKFTEEQELIVIQKIEELIPGKAITDSGKKTVKKWLSKYTAEEIITAADLSAEQKLDVEITAESASEFFSYIPRIASMRRNPPEYARLYYVRGILRNRVHVNENVVMGLLKDWVDSGLEIDDLEELAKTVRSWTQFRETVETFTHENSSGG